MIATHNRAGRLQGLVDALTAQDAAFPFEVVVVDDASTDGTWNELQRLRAIAPFELRTLRLPRNAGAATARNAGWQAASGQLIAFTDDDCIPQPEWLGALVEHLRHHDLVQGRTVPNPEQSEHLGPFSRTIDVTAEYGYYETCNMGYRREALHSAGGFDEKFRYPYGEDCDLAWRVKDAGAMSTFAPEALVYHDVWPSDFGAHLRDKVRREGLVLALKKHPRLRRRRGIFQNGTHPTALLAAGGGVAAVIRPTPLRLGVAALAGLTYAWNCRKYHPSPPRRVLWLGIVPMNWLADLYEVAVLARASLRYRTIVL